jgi:DNA-binding NarL/FixJ family response regulator
MDDVPEAVRRRKQLTRRQAQVVQLAASGLPDKAIARRLGLSKRTIEDHFTAARRRWNAATRAELTAMAAISAAGTSLPGSSDDSRVHEEENGAGTLTRIGGSCSENPEFWYIKISTEPSGADGSPLLRAVASHGKRDRGSRRGRPTVMTPERIAAARELLRDHTITQVAQKLGIGRTTIYAHLATITRTVKAQSGRNSRPRCPAHPAWLAAVQAVAADADRGDGQHQDEQ